MSGGRADYLRLRRELLISLAEAQRTEVGFLVTRLNKPLRAVQKISDTIRTFRFYHALALTSAGLLTRSRKRTLFRLGTLFALWRLFARKRP